LVDVLGRNNLVDDVRVGAVNHADAALPIPKVLLPTTLRIDDSFDRPFEAIAIFSPKFEIRESLL
jgi:hypothetical protein